jgi:hypothetical protein
MGEVVRVHVIEVAEEVAPLELKGVIDARGFLSESGGFSTARGTTVADQLLGLFVQSQSNKFAIGGQVRFPLHQVELSTNQRKCGLRHLSMGQPKVAILFWKPRGGTSSLQSSKLGFFQDIHRLCSRTFFTFVVHVRIRG